MDNNKGVPEGYRLGDVVKTQGGGLGDGYYAVVELVPVEQPKDRVRACVHCHKEVSYDNGDITYNCICGALGWKWIEQPPCKLCGHIHVGKCSEDAANAQFRCACPGTCKHGKHPAYCGDCQKEPK